MRRNGWRGGPAPSPAAPTRFRALGQKGRRSRLAKALAGPNPCGNLELNDQNPDVLRPVPEQASSTETSVSL